METRLALAIALVLPAICWADEPANEYRYKMSLDDEFVVKPTARWTVTEEKYLPLRFANVEITPKKGSGFSLMLYFKCDTPDLAQFDSMEKIEKSLRVSSKQYLPNAVEKTLDVKRIQGVARSEDRATTGRPCHNKEGEKVGYGCYAVLTDAEVAKKKTSEIAEGEFKYIVRGMIRLSPDSALGFSFMINELDTPGYRELMDYIQSFVKKE